MKLSTARSVRFVVEPPETLSALDRLYANVASYYGNISGGVAVHFELRHRASISASAYRGSIDAQRALFRGFGGRATVTLQSPLELLTPEIVDLAVPGAYFDATKTYVRLYESDDPDEAEALREFAATRFAELREREIAFAPVTVVSKRNQSRLERVVRFALDALDARLPSLRFIPLFGQPSLLPPYGTSDELGAGEAASVLERLLSLSADLHGVPRLEPAQSFVELVKRHYDPRQPARFHDRRGFESAFRVDADGTLRGRSSEPPLGDVFEEPLGALIGGASHRRVVALSDARVMSVCGACRFFGSCDGGPVVDAVSSRDECPLVRPMLESVERRFGFLERARLDGAASPPSAAVRGVRVLIPEDDAMPGSSRLSLSSGTEGPPLTLLNSQRGTHEDAGATPDDGSERYHVGARIPREPFRAPTLDEFRALVHSDTPSPLRVFRSGSGVPQHPFTPSGVPQRLGCSAAPLHPFGCSAAARVFRSGSARLGWERETDVAVVRLPKHVLSPLTRIASECGLYEVEPPKVTSPAEHPLWSAALEGLDAHLRQAGLSDRPAEAAVLYRSSPNLPTVTKVDRGLVDREAYVGLHLDSWEGTSLRRRLGIRNRLGINLSRQKRYFLFVDRTLADMARALGLSDADDLAEVTLFAGHQFMHRYPRYPVVRLELLPGEAYIAPTGNLVHDGASAAGQEPDVALHLLGFFGVPTARA